MFITRFFYGIVYFLVLIFEIIKAMVDVAIRIINGNVNPKVLKIRTDLKKPLSQTLLANSITLTPGTLTVDLDSESSTLTVATISPRERSDIIPFEKYIKKTFE